MNAYQRKVTRLCSLIRELRHEKGWTLEETEEYGWHDWKYLQRIENGKNITVQTLLKICDLYGEKPSKLFQKLEKET